ncbi:MAG: HAMP domain-containing histidine kinase [Candidatus Scalindua sp.]|nr:HAMP domain-containing histidine kinase [Candidatus Scalindua sp.]
MKKVIPFSLLFLLALYQQVWAVDSYNADENRQTILSRVEQAWVGQYPVTRVSNELAWIPINFLDKEGAPRGIETRNLQLDGTLAIAPVNYKYGLGYSMLWKVLPTIFIVIAVAIYLNRSFAQHRGQLAIACNVGESARRELQKARIELKLAYEQLKELDNLKSTFISSISHELRTPLNTIIGFSSLLMQGASGELTVQQKDNIERIHRTGNHLNGFISDVIDTSKVESGCVNPLSEKFALKKLIDEAIGIIRPQAEAKGLELNVQSAIWPEMCTDRKRLLQCLLNYLSNGVKYTENGHVALSVNGDEDEVHIVVTDTGIGISEADIPKLFKAFVRLKTHMRIKSSGVGLSLYLTKRIVTDLLKGSVSVESKLDSGSSFGLQIPTHIDEEESIEKEKILNGSGERYA